ncbi:MAG: DEAD/DEAH box helicase [Erysipelotrichaceae bacterium]
MRDQIIKGFEVACIDSNANQDYTYMPEFLSNDQRSGRKILNSIEKELIRCSEFAISVAFITDSGLSSLKMTLEELEKRHIKGRIITTDYLYFSEPKAIKALSMFDNIEVKMYRSSGSSDGFHTKGYLFRSHNIHTFIIGSSNMTLPALTTSKEWNCKIVCLEDGSYTRVVLDEFESIWQESENIENCIDAYELEYNEKKAEKLKINLPISKKVIKPNFMQKVLIDNIHNLINNNENKALLISATATGKTYASALAIQSVNVSKVLFLVHREQIAKKSMESYKAIFKDTKTYGLLSGTSKDKEKDFLFSTMQTMSKEDVYTTFDPQAFDFIVIDEAHRVGSNSYQEIMKYFKPKFYLGMTATPERGDGFDVYKAFDNNIAHEIRLHHALAGDLITPFNYFGISDIYLNDEKLEDNRKFSDLVCDERVKHIITKAMLYGYSGDRVKGLIFCSSNKEARELSIKFNEVGYRTIALSGEDSVSKREEAVARLVGEQENFLEYIFTVDIFNEGIDIPEINQVIMLRPTQSPIVFIQQLGRGLRKASNKEYVNILDFIGNYSNNYMIPIALSEDRTFNKDNIRRFLTEGIKMLPGSSTVHFDRVSKEKIFQSIDSVKLNDIKLIKDGYIQLKQKIGRIPKMIDFEIFEELDLSRIFDHKVGSYYAFLMQYEEEFTYQFNEIQLEMIKYLSRLIANGKRVHEIVLLQLVLNNNFSIEKWSDKMKYEYHRELNDTIICNIKNILTNNFLTGSIKRSYLHSVFIDEEFNISNVFYNELKDLMFKEAILDILAFSEMRYKRKFNQSYNDTDLCLYEKYTYEDVCRLLNWEKAEVALNIGGYKYDKYSNTYPVFINYDKSEDIADTIKYEDHFLSPKRLLAISKSGRSLKSDDIVTAVNSVQKGIAMHLFVRKNKDDRTSKEFYYLGQMVVCEKPIEFTMANTTKKAVELVYELKTAVQEDLYDYIIGEDE